MDDLDSPPDNAKVAIGISGGVDSCVSAFLLKKQGYNVVGLTGIMNENDVINNTAGKAAEFCESIDIEHFTLDLRQEFKDKVINYFEDSYKNGLTPNPCIVCNKLIKWGLLKDYAFNELRAHYYATGHYTKLMDDSGCIKIINAADSKKDQRYMLHRLEQSDVADTIFPLANLTKDDVYKIARQNNLDFPAKKESQDVCFLPEGVSTPDYLTGLLGEKQGAIIEIETGKVLGEHKGFYNFTIGQRKGIKIAAPYPLYVASIDAKKNIVYVGKRESVFNNEFIVYDINWQQKGFENIEFEALVKVRYASKEKIAKVKPLDQNKVEIRLNEPEFGITPGQAAVFYHPDEGYLIGGGWIDLKQDLFKIIY